MLEGSGVVPPPLLEEPSIAQGHVLGMRHAQVGRYAVDPFRLAARLNDASLAGVHFRPQYFQPTFQKHGGRLCGGAQVHVTDRDALQPYLMGLRVIEALRDEWSDFSWRTEAYEYEPPHKLHALEQCVGTPRFRELLGEKGTLEEWMATWEKPLADFLEARDEALIYR